MTFYNVEPVGGAFLPATVACFSSLNVARHLTSNLRDLFHLFFPTVSFILFFEWAMENTAEVYLRFSLFLSSLWAHSRLCQAWNSYFNRDRIIFYCVLLSKVDVISRWCCIKLSVVVVVLCPSIKANSGTSC